MTGNCFHPWGKSEADAASALIRLALAEDLNGAGDLTSDLLVPSDRLGSAVFVARAAGVVAGLPIVPMVLEAVTPGSVSVEFLCTDGTPVTKGMPLARVHGRTRTILTAERTALNFLQRLSGVATQTRRFADQLAGLPCVLLDTRKTTPGWRVLEKYAVRCGGGSNHRMGLYDGILIKDNHLAAVADHPRPVAYAVEEARRQVGSRVPIEVEVETLEQLEEALSVRPDVVLLDNMNLDTLRTAVARRNAVAPQVRLEASGGVRLENLRAIAETGVDRISVGALTHSAVSLDIALDHE
ncbi:MAG: carboxylating nicotinate-nucleotide diphosphorylase [Gemmatales bacterium]|nr:carboxylating nicotinate-nucleotide diphosphorylase [Gemmatales bacterium]MDW8386476.1 carboxylating nicotinate-nucleotide diphosphorylase [Gemmatales bacterium]